MGISKIMAAAVLSAGMMVASSALLAADAPAKPAQADTKTATVKKQIVTGKISVSKSGKEVSVIADSGILLVPDKDKASFAGSEGKEVKVSCIVGPDGKLIPEKIVEVMKSSSGKKK